MLTLSCLVDKRISLKDTECCVFKYGQHQFACEVRRRDRDAGCCDDSFDVSRSEKQGSRGDGERKEWL
ncbi:unnamed protein product [Citrullus colocynthis]|uniref:Uncharacterized protein n=1 Tax=Citrullus colocynthis TaxID=252529 RepID=A0ABP0XUY0_9ROSI